jgi:hypothetical protein
MNNLPYIKRQYDFSKAVSEFTALFDYLESLNSPLDGFVELQGRSLTTAGIKNLNQPHTWPELAGFIDLLHSISKELFGPISKESFLKNVARSWSNRYWQGGNITQHTHEGCDMVVSAYVLKPENGGNLELFYNGQWNEISVATNDIIVFAGNVLHRTQPNNSTDPRVIVSMNTNHYVQPYLNRMNDTNNLVAAKKATEEYSLLFQQKKKELRKKLCSMQ